VNDPATVTAAQRLSRDEFARAYAWPFLVGAPSLSVPRAPMRTLVGSMPALRGIDTVLPEVQEDSSAATPQLLVLAVRKRQDVFPEMITVGRTANNDIVINDATISKFHGFFREVDDHFELVDVGSRNGTKVMGRALVPRQPVSVTAGTRIRFGTVDLVLHTPVEAWDAIRDYG
jgi:hypothetical protein